MTAINENLLRTTARDILLADLQAHGNIVSDLHRAALETLLDTMCDYVTRQRFGRCVYALPTGMGKTSTIRAFFLALYRLRYAVPVSAAVSKVDALCVLKQSLIDGGIPEELLGLKHSVEGARLPSTGNDDRRFMLVTHTRVRSGSDFDLFGQHRAPSGVMLDRSLMIVDETLLRGESGAIDVQELRRALGAARQEQDELPSVGYLGACLQAIESALDTLRTSPDPSGICVALPHRDQALLQQDREAILRLRLRGFENTLAALLEVSQHSLRVISEGSVQAVLWIDEAVPHLLRNVLVLDASHPVKLLSTHDSELQELTTFDTAALKEHSNVQVTQIMSAGGYASVMEKLRRSGTNPVAAEVTDIVAAEWASSRGMLLFTYKPRMKGDPDHLDAVRKALRARGVNPDEWIDTGEQHADGSPVRQPKLRALTFGQETSLNGFEHCDVVVLAGVLHRSHADLAAALRAQAGRIDLPTPMNLLEDAVQSEVAAVVYQALSRGSCRRMEADRAVAMRGYVIHRHPGLRERLERVMPGIRWELRDPVRMPKANAVGVTSDVATALAEFLACQPAETISISSTKAKQALGIDSKDEARSKAFTRAGDELGEYTAGWVKKGRGFVRTGNNGQP
ncbi:hypothetical protein [Ramlibacter sp. AN1133]|uniref:hypothetical protein n=1 Tax=Ramlibacter sp. AN1133 TaxID=3133429 RepID=UPI0030BBD272